MGLECDNCGKNIGKEKVTEGRKNFCCQKCCDIFDHKNPIKAPVCEFC